jgi:hypothetical protein
MTPSTVLLVFVVALVAALGTVMRLWQAAVKSYRLLVRWLLDSFRR